MWLHRHVVHCVSLAVHPPLLSDMWSVCVCVSVCSQQKSSDIAGQGKQQQQGQADISGRAQDKDKLSDVNQSSRKEQSGQFDSSRSGQGNLGSSSSSQNRS